MVIADHADRSGNSSWILEELIKQGASNFCITTISDDKAIVKSSSKVNPGLERDDVELLDIDASSAPCFKGGN